MPSARVKRYESLRNIREVCQAEHLMIRIRNQGGTAESFVPFVRENRRAFLMLRAFYNIKTPPQTMNHNIRSIHNERKTGTD